MKIGDHVQHKKSGKTYFVAAISGTRILCEPDQDETAMWKPNHGRVVIGKEKLKIV